MRRVGWLVGAIAVLGLGLTACGDDAGSTTPTTAGDTSTTPTTELAITTEPSTSTTAPAPTDTLYFAKEGRVFTVVPGESPTAVTDGPRDDEPAPSPNGEQSRSFASMTRATRRASCGPRSHGTTRSCSCRLASGRPPRRPR